MSATDDVRSILGDLKNIANTAVNQSLTSIASKSPAGGGIARTVLQTRQQGGLSLRKLGLRLKGGRKLRGRGFATAGESGATLGQIMVTGKRQKEVVLY